MTRFKKIPPALKHGAYATTTLLPGENRAAFEKLHRALIVELSISGPLEEDTGETLARLLWRKQNLATIRNAEAARRHYLAIRSERLPDPISMLRMLQIDPAKHEEALRAAEDQARQELGDAYELVQIGSAATFDRLEKDLAIEERLDGMIDKCIKRLRGLKSMSTVSSPTPQQRVAGPTRAA
jgi:glycine/D-amino acid oxidase-like deaminating enzyme